MERRPEQAADTKSEKVNEAKEPGEGELLARNEQGEQAAEDADDRGRQEDDRQTPGVRGIEPLRFRNRQRVRMFAHGFFGCSSSWRLFSGTSARRAAWLRSRARM
jgi:hypothetical protein